MYAHFLSKQLFILTTVYFMLKLVWLLWAALFIYLFIYFFY